MLRGCQGFALAEDSSVEVDQPIHSRPGLDGAVRFSLGAQCARSVDEFAIEWVAKKRNSGCRLTPSP